MGNARGLITVATSIPPALARQNAGTDIPEYQKLCIQSWTNNGFRVLSVNDPEEISELAALYPDVEFVATHRNAHEWTGRKTPYIADLLLALKVSTEPVLGILNSDLLFEPSAAWIRELPAMVPNTLVMAHRYNTSALRTGALRQYFGVDCFFFDRTLASSLLEDRLPFAMGAPWWDYWLPCTALLFGRDIAVVDRPAILHLNHEPKYDQETWRKFASIFSQSTIRKFECLPNPPSDMAAQFIPHLRNIAVAIQEGGKVDPAFRPFMHQFVTALREKAVVWSPGFDKVGAAAAPAPILEEAFERFDQRLAAGQAFAQVRLLSAKGKWSAIGPDLVAAISQASDDPDIRPILDQIALFSSEFPGQNPARRVCNRIKSLFTGRSYSGSSD